MSVNLPDDDLEAICKFCHVRIIQQKTTFGTRWVHQVSFGLIPFEFCRITKAELMYPEIHDLPKCKVCNLEECAGIHHVVDGHEYESKD